MIAFANLLLLLRIIVGLLVCGVSRIWRLRIAIKVQTIYCCYLVKSHLILQIVIALAAARASD